MIAALIAVNVKIPALTLLGIAGALLVAGALLQRAHMPQLLRGTAIGVGLGLVVLAPQLTRNLIELGVPLGPFPLRVLGIALGEVGPEQIWYLEQPGDEHWGVASELVNLATMLGLVDPIRPTFGAPSFLLMLILPFSLFALAREQRVAAVLFTLVIASQLATYWSASFAPLRNNYGWCNGRLFMLVPTIAALLAPRMLRSPRTITAFNVYLVLAVLLSVSRYLSLASTLELLPLLVYGALVLALALAWPRIAALVPARTLVVSAGIAAALALVFATPLLERARASVRYAALEYSQVGHRIPVAWALLAQYIDKPERPRRIAITSGPLKEGDHQLIYFYLGSKLQNELVYVSPRADGAVPVYDRPRPNLAGADPRTWVQRVLASGVQYVAVLNPPPLETRWLVEHKQAFKLVAGNHASLLFKVLRPTAASASVPTAQVR
jgi:hypothetical protein